MCISQVRDTLTLSLGKSDLFLPAYIGNLSGPEAIRANVEILQNAVEAVERLCPKFKVWIFQTGGKVRSTRGFASDQVTN